MAIACEDDARWTALCGVIDTLAGFAQSHARAAARLADRRRLDGLVSAWTSVRTAEESEALLQSAGIEEQLTPKRFIRITEPLKVSDGDKWAMFEPFEGFKVNFEIEFNHPIFKRRAQRVLHLHRLDDGKALTGGDAITGVDEELEQPAVHRRPHYPVAAIRLGGSGGHVL